MSETRDIEPILDDWFAEEIDVLPDRSIEAVLATVEHTAQRRTLRVPRRLIDVHAFPRVAALLGAAAIVALLAGGLSLMGGSAPLGVAEPDHPSPTPTRSPSAVPTAVPPSAAAPGVAVRGVVPGPGVAADGTIVFGVDQGGSAALMAIRPDGSDLRDLVPSGQPQDVCCAVVSPDGLEVIFKVDGERLPRIEPVIEGQGFAETWPTDLAPGVELTPRAWSGFDIALASASTEQPDQAGGIYLSIDNGGALLVGDVVQATTPPAGRSDLPLSFSPDGSRLLFLRVGPITTLLGEVGDLYVVDRGRFTTGGASGAGQYIPAEPVRLNPASTWVIASDLFGDGASWSPDGTQVAFSAFAGSADSMSAESRAYVADAATGQGSAITPTTTDMTSARWSPDGSWIAVDLAGPSGSSRQVALVRPDGSDLHGIASFSGGSCCAQWSPDSRRLIAQATNVQGAGLFVIEADGSGSSLVADVGDPYLLRGYTWGPAPEGTTP
jgi:Tol biopolymer transport system component